MGATSCYFCYFCYYCYFCYCCYSCYCCYFCYCCCCCYSCYYFYSCYSCYSCRTESASYRASTRLAEESEGVRVRDRSACWTQVCFLSVLGRVGNLWPQRLM